MVRRLRILGMSNSRHSSDRYVLRAGGIVGWSDERRGSAMNVGMGWYVVRKNGRAIERPCG